MGKFDANAWDFLFFLPFFAQDIGCLCYTKSGRANCANCGFLCKKVDNKWKIVYNRYTEKENQKYTVFSTCKEKEV